MHSERKPTSGAFSALSARKITLILLVVLYAVGAILAASNIITHSRASTNAIEQILLKYSMQNEGAHALENFDKVHPILGMLVSSPLRHQMELPSTDEADSAIYSDVKHLLKTVRMESSIAAWWSWFLLSFSLFYVITIVTLEGSFTARAVIFSLTCVVFTFFVIGIFAPAMVIWTAPTIPMATGNLEFVLQHEVRGIAAIIWELLTNGHWIIGGFLLLFSIVTPLTKAFLTIVATASHSKTLNFKIGQLLHIIGKWSMADVFVAAVLLALYALKFQEATKSIPCLGLYYFIGYCLLSMSTSELLVRSEIVTGNDKKKSEKKFGLATIAGLFAILFCFILGSGLYTYQQYTVNIKQTIKASGTPLKLNNADLVLPAHK